MPRPGTSNNPAGKPKGTISKRNRTLKENISNFLQKNWSKIERDIKTLDPKDRVQAYERLLSYVMPRLKSIDATVEIEKKLDSLTDSQLNELIDKILTES